MRNSVLGSVSDSKDSDTFNASTVVGFMEAIIAYVQNIWDCPVVFFTGTKYGSIEYQAMVDVLSLLQTKWGISVLDLWNDEEMNGVIKISILSI